MSSYAHPNCYGPSCTALGPWFAVYTDGTVFFGKPRDKQFVYHWRQLNDFERELLAQTIAGLESGTVCSKPLIRTGLGFNFLFTRHDWRRRRLVEAWDDAAFNSAYKQIAQVSKSEGSVWYPGYYELGLLPVEKPTADTQSIYSTLKIDPGSRIPSSQKPFCSQEMRLTQKEFESFEPRLERGKLNTVKILGLYWVVTEIRPQLPDMDALNEEDQRKVRLPNFLDLL